VHCHPNIIFSVWWEISYNNRKNRAVWAKWTWTAAQQLCVQGKGEHAHPDQGLHDELHLQVWHDILPVWHANVQHDLCYAGEQINDASNSADEFATWCFQRETAATLQSCWRASLIIWDQWTWLSTTSRCVIKTDLFYENKNKSQNTTFRVTAYLITLTMSGNQHMGFQESRSVIRQILVKVCCLVYKRLSQRLNIKL
jgi:hypothetical protein